MMKYLLNPRKKKSAAHLWNGKDTYCRMYSTGGLTKFKQSVFDTPAGKPICAMCTNVYVSQYREIPKTVLGQKG